MDSDSVKFDYSKQGTRPGIRPGAREVIISDLHGSIVNYYFT